MAQTTNLNVSPYFDDFNSDDNYCKVLFKPGLPVQARELTGLQSILQNQIAKFGQHFFKVFQFFRKFHQHFTTQISLKFQEVFDGILLNFRYSSSSCAKM